MANNNEYQRKYQLERYHRLRRGAIERLGGVCCGCGTNQDLNIDHIDASAKEIPLSKIWAVAKERRERELGKCQLLCVSCHKEKTSRHRDILNRRYGRFECSTCGSVYGDRLRYAGHKTWCR